MKRAWSFLTLDDEDRQFAGNAGYGDDLERFYKWDQTVPNHRKVAEGDLAVLRNSRQVLGLGWIDEIQIWTGDKERYRCPSCSKTGFKRRIKLEPLFRCPSCDAEFDTPDVEHLRNIDLFVANYERTWRPLDHPMPVSALEIAYLKNAKQHAIRELDIGLIRQALSDREGLGQPWWRIGDRGGVDLGGGHHFQLGKVRKGQQGFREALMELHGEACAISGPLHPAMLEAAHLYRFADRPEHRLDGGLLLRRDLQALFDRFLLLIDPDREWRVAIAPQLAEFPMVWELNNRPLVVEPDRLPNAIYLREHAAFCRSSWSQLVKKVRV